ncbi:hypothetical protein B0H17DRAFT_930625 [Mycena rosella]|uniref:Uncharacterized protein n=1 Tax=Mycena rosella TaxID=1033263 RepID=A0AAD7GHR3_MYCRO|nr:hypothetical protein B0H17DRAFT_930625 [Mycena rosella]
MNVACPDCGAPYWIDERVLPSSKHTPDFGMCCNSGKVQLDRLQEPPQPLHRLLTGADAQAQEFRSHITQYNAALAFMSLGVSNDKNINRYGSNAWVFRILGNLHHLSGALTVPEGVSPSYAQLYMYDPTVALRQRMNRNSDLRGDTMQGLQTMLMDSHPYAAMYKEAYEVLEELGDDVEDAEVRLRALPGTDHRRYNLLKCMCVFIFLCPSPLLILHASSLPVPYRLSKFIRRTSRLLITMSSVTLFGYVCSMPSIRVPFDDGS